MDPQLLKVSTLTPESRNKETKLEIATINVGETFQKVGLQNCKKHFEVTWRNLSYVVNKTNRITRCFKRNENKITTILKGLNGQFKSGQLTAVMGPSGSGKTTLLECIAGKREKGVSGEVMYSGKDHIKLSFISQNDQLLNHLTVRESLIFASKLKNKASSNSSENRMALDIVNNAYKKSNIKNMSEHKIIAQNLLCQLGLEHCGDVKVSNCSGGQLKRLSIAQELVSRPNILILDEPTSGLDSASCYQCLEVLQQLVQNNDAQHPISVIVTIHQPSFRAFTIFQKVYFLSHHGQCIYDGAPTRLVQYLASAGLNCPHFNNPADYMTEIASDEYGIECTQKLALIVKNQDNNKVVDYITIKPAEGVESMSKIPEQRLVHSFWKQVFILFHRTILSTLRDPMLTSLRIISHVTIAIFIGLLYGNKVGLASGCPPQLTGLDSLMSSQQAIYDDLVTTTENVANIFFAVMFIMFGAMMPTILTFPMELNVFLKERTNGWYSCGAYYLAKTLADVPFQMIFPALYGSIIYLMQAQIWDYWRFSMFLSIIILVAFVGQSQGMFVSALFLDNATAAVFIAPILTIPALLFAGFFVRIRTMPQYLVPISYFSYLRFGFEAIISVIYGFNRCSNDEFNIKLSNQTDTGLVDLLTAFLPDDEDGINGTSSGASMRFVKSIVNDMQQKNPFLSNVVGSGNSTSSYVMKQFDITDDSLHMNLMYLVIMFLVVRLLTYFALLWKTNSQQK